MLSVATAVGGLAHWVSATSATMPPHQVTEIDKAVNLGLGYAIVVVGAIWVLQCLKELWQLVTARPVSAAWA